MTDAAALYADGERWRALRALPRDLNAKLYLIYMQALEECGSDVPGDPIALLDIEEGDFYALADRAGIERSYKYRIYRQVRGSAPVATDASAPLITRHRNGTSPRTTDMLHIRPPRTTALYRYYDEQDRLLYIGITDELTGRVSGHVDGSSWMDFAVRSTITRYTERPEATDAEVKAIKSEHPLFNQQHNNTPEAQRRLVEYLIEHDRLDLLAPSVSRG